MFEREEPAEAGGSVEPSEDHAAESLADVVADVMRLLDELELAAIGGAS